MCYIKINKTNHILSNGAATKYVYGRGLIGEESGSTFKTYHFDFRGSTVAITDGNGNITDTFAYDTYGKVIIFQYDATICLVKTISKEIYPLRKIWNPDACRGSFLSVAQQ